MPAAASGSAPRHEGGVSRILSAETINERVNRKSITDVLHELITSRSAKDTNNEISILRFENDMVTTFFDNITRFSDQFTYSFIEDMKKDIDSIVQTLYQGANELAIFYTYLLMILRKLSPVSGSFTNTLIFCKNLSRKLNDDSQAPSEEFNKFFLNHLFKNYCSIIRECPNKRQHVCELIFAHSCHDLNLRIKVVQNLKNHIPQEEVVYACQAYLVAQESEFNE